MSYYLMGCDVLGAPDTEISDDAEVKVWLREALGSTQYTDAFFVAKAQVDEALKKADSSINPAQHASVMYFLTVEAKIWEGFRRGVEDKNVKLVDSATEAMRQLASLVRRTLINPMTGEARPITMEAATKALAEAGGELQKFKEGIGDTLSWLKWVIIAGAVVLVLGIGASVVVPLIVRRRLRMF